MIDTTSNGANDKNQILVESFVLISAARLVVKNDKKYA